jgi:hypothetical protein
MSFQMCPGAKSTRRLTAASHNLPHPLQSRKLFLNDEGGGFWIKIWTTAKNINVNLVQFRVRVSTKVALGEYENSSGPLGFKLVKGSAHDCEPAPFSDPIHNCLQVIGLGDPHTFDVSDEMLHITLGVGYFI